MQPNIAVELASIFSIDSAEDRSEEISRERRHDLLTDGCADEERPESMTREQIY